MNQSEIDGLVKECGEDKRELIEKTLAYLDEQGIYGHARERCVHTIIRKAKSGIGLLALIDLIEFILNFFRRNKEKT